MSPSTIADVADRIPELFGWLAERGVAPAGAPFLRYHVVDMDRGLVVEAGVPVATPVPEDAPPLGHVVTPGPRPGALPAGRYAVVQHRGHPDELERVTEELLAWASAEGLAWDADDDRRAWGARVESYLTDPAQEPDMARWEHELAFRLAG